MKTLNIYLCDYINDKYKFESVQLITKSYNEFNKSIESILGDDNDNIFKILYTMDYPINTYCLSALDFKYLNIFDEINVKGEYFYATFKIEGDKKEITPNTIINYDVYNYKNSKCYFYEKEIKYYHNLYNLVTRGYFKILNTNIKTT